MRLEDFFGMCTEFERCTRALRSQQKRGSHFGAVHKRAVFVECDSVKPISHTKRTRETDLNLHERLPQLVGMGKPFRRCPQTQGVCRVRFCETNYPYQKNEGDGLEPARAPSTVSRNGKAISALFADGVAISQGAILRDQLPIQNSR